MTLVRLAVVVPVKPFERAKQRLANTLSDEERATLARALATRVVAAAGASECFVVCNDDAVAAWAVSLGATALQSSVPGLNTNVGAAVHHLGQTGFDHVVIAHGDLPLAHDLDSLAVEATVTLVPDRHGDGTNVLAVPTRAGFWFRYGPRSFHRHVEEARRVGLPVEIAHDELLALDVDTAADLRHPLVQEELSSIRTNQARSGSTPLVGR
jgi:2-phospho-L-lactate guanylyltransferase